MLKRRKRKASFVGILKLQNIFRCCFPRGIPEVLESRRTPAYNFWPCGGSILSCAVSLFAMALAHFVVTSSAQVTSQRSLNLGILVAESCDGAMNAKIDALVSQAFQDVRERILQENGSAVAISLGFSSVTNSYCKLQDFVKNMDVIFGNTSIHAVLVLASRDLHASLVTMADIYDKAYLPLNSFLLLPPESQALSLSPSYDQRSLIMSTILDKYQWQSVYVVYTNVQAFEDFAFVFYIKMTLLKFNVTLYAPMGSPISTQDAIDSLNAMGEAKVVLLLMDVADQLTFLAAASTLSKTKDHAFFTFTKTPYDVTATSLVGQKADVTTAPRFINDSSAANVNILNSVFVIASSFPADASRNSTSGTRMKRHSGDGRESTPEKRFRKKRSDVLEFSSERELSSEISQEKMSLVDLMRSSTASVPCLNGRCVHTTSMLKTSSFSSSTISPANRQSVSSSNPSLTHAHTVVFNTITNSTLSYFARARNTALSQEKVNQDFSSVQNLGRRGETTFPLRSAGLLLNDIEETTRPREKEAEKNYLVFASEKRISGNSQMGHRPLSMEPSFALRSKRDIESFQPSDVDIRAVYDVSYAVAYSVFKYLETNSPTQRVPTGQQLIKSVRNITFSGNSGEYVIGDDQRVQYDFTLYDYNDKSGVMEPRTHYQAASPSDWTLVSLDETAWPDDLLPGPDPCFKQLPNCNDGLKASYIAGIVISALVLVIIGVVAALIFRRYWLNKEMTKGPNKVILNTEDLVFVLRKEMGKGSRILKSRATLLEKDNAPDLIRGSDPNRSMASINELSDYTETARFNGDLVHVKELDIKGFEMRSKLLTYIRMCRDLRHENLNPYVGFLADPLRPSIVMEYCSRGSLNDIIHNDDFKLDWDFKLSLLTDLVRGVRYLHSSALRYHGHITSKNCVIDSRFVLKITDYGIPGIMERCKALMEFETRDLLWSAPELLRDPILLQKGSDKGDLYAMAIIFQEVTLRSEPYSTTGLTPEEIIKKLKKPPPLIRPSVTPQAAPPQFIQIMKQCWSEMPEMRPNIDEVYDQFKKLTGGKKANIVDTMFKMLEKYSTDLEDIVADRTMQLEEEKKKTDQLLFRMLPPTVAESLKIGRNVEAECFDEVTIYFSDIVGFTTISAMSTPMQVVDLLNDLYTMFDATINDHDVYKVETIGDAYMVVSGLPIRNGNRHAGEIGTLALVLLSQCGKFTIRHMPQVPLRLRIGLHTGSCVAGVVGLTMPRFCLFGDTVNTASRMESTGAAFRIHISEHCKVALDVLGGYFTEYRGQTELKGKGLHNTYWLVGKEGFDKELPEPPPLVGDTSHGLDSILGDLKLETMLHVSHQDTLAKSSSAPDIIHKSDIPLPDSLSLQPSGSGGAGIHSTSAPGGCSQPKHNATTSVVKADINLTGRVVPAAGQGTASDNLEVCASEAESLTSTASVLKNKHSESNDSGFGSERKHSHGNDNFTPGAAGHNGGSEKPKRAKSSVVSSSDVTLNTNYALLMDLTDELTPVTEV